MPQALAACAAMQLTWLLVAASSPSQEQGCCGSLCLFCAVCSERILLGFCTQLVPDIQFVAHGRYHLC